jgi:hypothetical protein
MRYIINDTRDYADEFEYTIRSYLTQEKLNCLNENQEFIISVFEETSNSEFECYFGTNECFDLSISEFFDLITDAKEISEKEYLILKKFEIASLDIVDRVISYFLDYAYDLFDVENATEEQNQNIQKAVKIYRIIKGY